MAERIIFPEFRNELEFTRYPFADSATLVASNTRQELEKDVFLDASLYPIGGSVQLFISSVVVSTRRVTIWLSDRLTTNIASSTFDPLSPPENLEFVDKYGRPAGILVSEAVRLSRFAAWESTEHVFAVQATEFVASCVIPTPGDGVRGLVSPDGEILTGNVWLIGDNGVVLTAENACTIRVDIVGDPLFVRKLCQQADLFATPRLLRTINGCPPDANGDYKLVVGDHLSAKTVLRINPTDDGLQIEAVGELVRTS